MTPTTRSILEGNLQRVRERLRGAAERGGRDARDVTLVAVTKYVDAPLIRELFELGVRDFGESRPQSLWEKQPQLPPECRWHLIGYWQTNKVRRTLPMVTLAHGIDRWSLAEVVSDEAMKQGRRLPVLIEVKFVGEEAKHGFAPTEVQESFVKLCELPGLDLRGLMCMASQSDDPESARPTFAALRKLRDQLRASFPNGPALDDLSMGMSQDFEVAVEEGATQVRVGSSLFEGLIDD